MRRIVFTNPPRGQRVDEVYVRFGNSTRKLTPAELLEYSEGWSREPFQKDSVGQAETIPLEATALPS
jgi:hypothetical protein